MTKTQVLALLRKHKNDRGIENYGKKLAKKTGLKTFGLGLTQLRKLAKEIGRDHKLAQTLWKSDVYDARIIGLLIDDPKQISREQVEEQVEQLKGGLFAHVFSSCGATLAKTPFAFDLACDWIESDHEIRRRCGYALIYELSKKNPKGLTDEFCIERINHIEAEIHDEEMWVRESMAGALLGMGKRNKKLNKAAVKAAKKIGPIDIDYGDDNSCEPVDILKHLTSDYIKQKLGV